jgi:hypothetical protein
MPHPSAAGNRLLLARLNNRLRPADQSLPAPGKTGWLSGAVLARLPR